MPGRSQHSTWAHFPLPVYEDEVGLILFWQDIATIRQQENRTSMMLLTERIEWNSLLVEEFLTDGEIDITENVVNETEKADREDDYSRDLLLDLAKRDGPSLQEGEQQVSNIILAHLSATDAKSIQFAIFERKLIVAWHLKDWIPVDFHYKKLSKWMPITVNVFLCQRWFQIKMKWWRRRLLARWRHELLLCI